MKTEEKIEEIDNILASFEDWMHGSNGDNCTKARKLLAELKVNNSVSDDVIICEAEVCKYCGSEAIINFGLAKKCSDCRKMI